MRVLCAPDPVPINAAEGMTFSLLCPPSQHNVGRLGCNFPVAVQRAGLQPSERVWDFVAIALSVAAADFGCLRSKSPDGWTREIELSVSVLDPDFWVHQKLSLQSALAFLTGDIWDMQFLPHGSRPPTSTRRERRHLSGDCVCLFSGGADSLVGAIDLVTNGHSPILVSQIASGDKSRQRMFARSLDLTNAHLQLSHAIKTPAQSERSQRARSIIFLAYGLLAAMHLSECDNGNPKDLIVPENGFISLNVPLTPLRIGSLSTRTTHPFFIRQIQSIFDACGFSVHIKNPYQHKTKGEMFSGCHNQEKLVELISKSTSCGRFGRYGYSHCGRCVPCMVRRAAFVCSGIHDQTSYKFENLSINDNQHLCFDDVQAVRFAVQSVSISGVKQWAGSAISYAQLGTTDPYFNVAHRGIQELETFLRGMQI